MFALGPHLMKICAWSQEDRYKDKKVAYSDFLKKSTWFLSRNHCKQFSLVKLTQNPLQHQHGNKKKPRGKGSFQKGIVSARGLC